MSDEQYEQSVGCGGIPVNTPLSEQKLTGEYEQLKKQFDGILEKQQRKLATKIARRLWGNEHTEELISQVVYEELRDAGMHR